MTDEEDRRWTYLTPEQKRFLQKRANQEATARLEALNKASQDALDAARYRYLMAHAVCMAPASMDGPEYPKLSYHADIWNARPNESPQSRITKKIDAAIAAEKEQAK